MKINILNDDISRWALATALGEDESRRKEFMNATKKYEDGLDVVLTVDGVEFDFSRIMHRIDEMFDQAVERAAGKKYIEIFDRVSDEISEELKEIRERLIDIRREKLPGIRFGYEDDD